MSLIQQKIGGDLTDLVLAKPYSSDYSTCTEEAKRDQNSQARPELVTKIADFDQYGTIILGYPNWWGTIPMPIATVLSSYNFAGKTILPLCSHGGSRLGRSLDDIKKLAPQARILEGLAVYTTGGSSLPEDLEAWLKKNGLAA
jgi:flavodoxin